ncbi:MAG TPA: hypothetical protein VFH40_08795, partial [Gemmatimonadales bacterium]|nr:hypothetical protein [Gemmatimonadales bacterium]
CLGKPLRLLGRAAIVTTLPEPPLIVFDSALSIIVQLLRSTAPVSNSCDDLTLIPRIYFVTAATLSNLAVFRQLA